MAEHSNAPHLAPFPTPAGTGGGLASNQHQMPTQIEQPQTGGYQAHAYQAQPQGWNYGQGNQVRRLGSENVDLTGQGKGN